MTELSAIARRDVEIQPIPVEQIVARMRSVEQIVAEVMEEGVHFGDVPGVPGQKMIDKPGVEVLAATFQLALDYVVDATTTSDGELRYIVKCRVLQQASEAYLGSGMGECSTAETKYLWRRASKEEYEAAGEDRRRVKTWTDKRGHTEQTLQVRENEADKANTALKQACTRAARDAVLGVLGVRGMVLKGGRQVGRQSRGPAPRRPTERGDRRAPQERPPIAGSQRVRELVGFAAERGISQETILEDLRAERDYQAGSLAPLTLGEYEWCMARYGAFPPVDPETGEVAGDEPLDQGASR
ncbi:MAG: hypothetical protein QM323_11615 [Acidobacteriota bacterium]|nr:hypothetical protein [Acidobacteriota bacterium]